MRRAPVVGMLLAALSCATFAQDLTIEGLRAKYPPNVQALDPGFH